MNAISIFAVTCVLISSLPLRANPGAIDDAPEKRRTVEKYLRGLDDDHGFNALGIYRSLKEGGYSDEEIRDGLLQRIHQKNWRRERRAPFFAVRAADAALDLFRGDPLVEKTVLEADRPDPDHYLPEYASVVKRGSLMWDAIAKFGSDELVQEYKELQKDHFAKNPEGLRVFDKRVSARPRFHRDQVPEELKPEKRAQSQDTKSANDQNGTQPGRDGVQHSTPGAVSGIASHWPWLLGLCGLGMAAVGFVRKWRALWLGGAALIVVSTAILFFTSLKQPASPEPVAPQPMPSENPTPGSAESTTPPARFKTNAWRPPREGQHSPTGPRVKTPDDIFNEKVTELMAPFSARDPQDKTKYLKDCETAAAQLLDLLSAGKPAGYGDDNWPGMVSRIIEMQACTPASMDRCLAAISKWLDDPARKDTELEAALSTMMKWDQMKPLKRDTPEFKRYENVAEMQVALFEKASPRIRGQLLRNLELAAKIVSEPKSQMPRKLISPERLAGLMEKMREATGSDATIDSQVIMVINNRVKSQPESFPVFENMAKEILTGGKLDPMGKMSGLNLLATQAKTSGGLPPWMDDAGISREIASLQREAAAQGADRPAVRKTDFVSGQAMMVIRDRLAADPAMVAKHYGEVLMTIAGDKESNQAWRIEAVQMAVKSGALSPAEARVRLGTDPVIGLQVKEAYPEK